jgi:F-type H+-transporting ATPase subunit gamma
MTANLVIEKLLPVEDVRDEEARAQDENAAQHATNPDEKKKRDSPIDYIYEQPEEQLLGRLLPRYIETQVLRSMLESSAAEYAARMVAMDSATKNAGDVIEALTLHMNKVRQAAITKEIIEIVSGASSTA